MFASPTTTSPSGELKALDDRTEQELDELDFGVVCLDEEGTILRYNLYESRLARLDRNQVLGRNFFTEVAPCTRTEAFEGRFRAFVAGATPGRSERFEYLFDFKFGAQEVSIELLRAAAAPRFYLLINRRRVSPPREGVAPAQLAALQRDLAPEEPAQGVLRDGLERRFVDAPAPLFAALRATCARLAPEAWPLFCDDWGVQWGRRVSIDLEASCLESRGASLRELPMRDLARVLSDYFFDRGWGSVSFDFAHSAEGVLRVRVERSVLAESAPRSTRSGEKGLSCHLLAGALAGVLTSVARRRLSGREVECACGGAEACTMLLVAQERVGPLEAALQEGVRGANDALAALRRGGPR